MPWRSPKLWVVKEGYSTPSLRSAPTVLSWLMVALSVKRGSVRKQKVKRNLLMSISIEGRISSQPIDAVAVVHPFVLLESPQDPMA